MSLSLDSKKIAKRYVLSLFHDVTKKKDIDSIAKDMNDLRAMIESSSDLQAFLKSPLHSRAVQEKTIESLANKAKLSSRVSNMLILLAQKGRLSILVSVIEESYAHLDRLSNVVPVNVATARTLSAADQKKIQSDIKKALGRDIAMQSYIDENLIGGIVIQIESTLIDGSIKTKLDRLEREMVARAA